MTLADGSAVKLPFKSVDPFVLFSNGKYQLVEKGDVLEWTVGKKAATLCSPEDGDVATPFDQPSAVDNVDLPPNKGNPDATPSVNCYRYPGFTVKEVDLGEVGAEKLAILPESAKCERERRRREGRLGPGCGLFPGCQGQSGLLPGA